MIKIIFKKGLLTQQKRSKRPDKALKLPDKKIHIE